MKTHIYKLLLIFLLGFLLRLYSLNWDQSQHLHPDERMIVMVTENIKFPSAGSWFSVDSPLNPHFFAYGSFPIYFLKIMAHVFSIFDPDFLKYDKINLLGRGISAFFDSLTIILVFNICQKIFLSTKKSLLAALIYALSILPIQLSHFYAVDTLLTFFIIFTLYNLICLYQQFNLKNAFYVGLGCGLALATKISASVLIFSIGLSLMVGIFLTLKKQIFGLEIKFFSKIFLFSKQVFHPRFWVVTKRHCFINIIQYFSFIILITVIVFIICQPFAIFDFSNFWRQLNEQQAMTKNAFVFPYTLQYVNTPAYFYQLKNIFIFGLGPIIGTISFIGLIFSAFKLVKGLFNPGNESSEGSQIILLSFFVVYFLIIGNFEVKFMRYCLPLYPIFAIFAANFLFSFKPKLSSVIIILTIVFHTFLLTSFLSIYRAPNTRVRATEWINKFIPPGSVIAREHWDDGLPLGNINNYQLLELALYDSDDDPRKWTIISQQLSSANYLIIASNRLYTPLVKLTDCSSLPKGKCYQKTADYYNQLFSGKLGYTQVAEFTDYPLLFNIPINDQFADESFTVYDHPRVIIFKKN